MKLEALYGKGEKRFTKVNSKSITVQNVCFAVLKIVLSLQQFAMRKANFLLNII